jgi:hypothetical protein
MDKDFLKNAIQKNKINFLESSKKPVDIRPKFPSLPQMAANLTRDVIKTVQTASQGVKASDEDANRRKEICEKCEFFNKSQQRCTKCGCFMAVKVYLKASNCPINKW